MSLIFATQLTGIATAVLAVFAIVTAVFAFLAYRAQAQEVGILQRQMKEQQDAFEREAAERHRAQAARVFIGVSHSPDSVASRAINASEFPVYDAELWYLDDSGLESAALPDELGTILPGDDVSSTRQFESRGTALMNTILTFRDAANVRWIRMPAGPLEEQTRVTAQESVLAALGLPLPGASDSP